MEPPTDRPFPHRPPLPPSLCFAFPFHPSRHSHTISSTSTPNFSLPPLSISPLSVLSRENALEKLVVACRVRFVSAVREKKRKEKKKRGARDRARTLPRVSTISNRPEALEIRFGRLMIGTEGSGRSSSRGEPFLERPPGDQKARPLSLSPVLLERERRGTRRSCLDRGEGRTVRRMPVIYSDARFDSPIAGK